MIDPTIREKIPTKEAVRRKRLRFLLYEENDGECFWCKTKTVHPMSYGKEGNPKGPRQVNEASIDHYPVKWSDGGKTEKENVVLSCFKCNTQRENDKRKHDQPKP